MKLQRAAGKTALALAIAGLLAGGPVAAQAGAHETSGPFGRHVSECAREQHGKRPDPPAITCVHEHDGVTEVHSFGTFGEMVQHLREHHLGHGAHLRPGRTAGER